MSSGIAVCLGPASSAHFKPGSSLYRLYPSLGMFEHEDAFVVVAETSRAVDHGLSETTVFKTNEKGEPVQGWGETGEALNPRQRVIGRADQDAALANLGGSGYIRANPDEVDQLKLVAADLAKAFALSKLDMSPVDAADYANNNWGMFAATHLVQTGLADPPVQSKNKVDWKSFEVEESGGDFLPFF